MIENADIAFSYSMSNDIILKKIGAQLKQMRLNKNLSQKQLCELSGVSRSTISEIENKGVGTLSSMVQIIRGLEKLELLNILITSSPVSPLQIAKLAGKTRKRASHTNKIDTSQPDSEW